MLHSEATVPIFTDLIYGTLYPAMMDRGRGRDNALAIAEWKPRRTGGSTHSRSLIETHMFERSISRCAHVSMRLYHDIPSAYTLRIPN